MDSSTDSDSDASTDSDLRNELNIFESDCTCSADQSECESDLNPCYTTSTSGIPIETTQYSTDHNNSTSSCESVKSLSVRKKDLYDFLDKVNDTNVVVIHEKELSKKGNSVLDDLFDVNVHGNYQKRWETATRNSDSLWGPPCNLCNDFILQDSKQILYNDTRYWIHLQEDEYVPEHPEIWERYQMLQCNYCLNFYHRHKCSLSMTDKSYWEIIKKRDWACPICVPAFVPQGISKTNRTKKRHRSSDELLVKIVKLLSRICIVTKVDEISLYNRMYDIACDIFDFDNG